MALELAFESSGSGAPLLILHGLFGSGGNWRGVAKRLAESHEVYTVDLRNHGSSPWAETMHYFQMADDVRHFIVAHGLVRPIVLGHSMGGKTAMALALLYPDLVDQLIVVDIAPVSYADALTPFAQAMRAPEVLAAASRAEMQRRLAALLPDASVAPFLMQNAVTRNEHFDWRINLPVIAASLGALSDFPRALRGQRFHRPLTVIAGEQSQYVPLRDASSYAPMFAQTRVDVIAGAGHWVHADRPEAFMRCVERALSGSVLQPAA
jgi:esterase